MMSVFRRAAWFALVSLLVSCPAWAAEVKLAWDASAEPVAGYIVSYGTARGQYSTRVDVGSATTHTVTGLTDGRVYYFIVEAYDAEGASSEPSAEVSYAAAPQSPLVGDLPPAARIDAAWQNRLTGDIVGWQLTGAALFSAVPLGPSRVDPAWSISASGDFNRDGHTDLIWQHRAGWIAVWFMKGGEVLDTRYLTINNVGDPQWRVRGAADFNNDLRDDLVWQHEQTGHLAVWLMWDNQVLDTRMLTPERIDPKWRLAGVGDLNRDNHPDLVWQHEDGWLAGWYMRGTSQIDTGYLSTNHVSPDWQLRGVKDINGDLRADLLFQHETEGWLATWFLDGVRVLDTRWLTPNQVGDADWKLVAVR